MPLNTLYTSTTQLLQAKAASDTAAATGSWTLVTKYDGAMLVTQNVGAVTAGSLAGKLYHADDDSGSNSASVSGASWTAVTTANDPAVQTITVNGNGLKPYLQYVGTVTTGPVDLAVTLIGTPKY